MSESQPGSPVLPKNALPFSPPAGNPSEVAPLSPPKGPVAKKLNFGQRKQGGSRKMRKSKAKKSKKVKSKKNVRRN